MKNLIIPFALILVVSLSNPASSKGLFSTRIEVTIVDEVGNAKKNAIVKLYESEDDYRQSQNELFSGTTNKKGKVVFKKVKVIPYYIDARKENKKNDGMDVQIKNLKEGKLNKVSVVIE